MKVNSKLIVCRRPTGRDRLSLRGWPVPLAAIATFGPMGCKTKLFGLLSTTSTPSSVYYKYCTVHDDNAEIMLCCSNAT